MRAQWHHWGNDVRKYSPDELAKMGLSVESGQMFPSPFAHGAAWLVLSSIWWTWYVLRKAAGCPKRRSNGRRTVRRTETAYRVAPICVQCGALTLGICELCGQSICGGHSNSLVELDGQAPIKEDRIGSRDDHRLCDDCIKYTCLQQEEQRTAEFGDMKCRWCCSPSVGVSQLWGTALLRAFGAEKRPAVAHPAAKGKRLS